LKFDGLQAEGVLIDRSLPGAIPPDPPKLGNSFPRLA
jgi:hypothetical protein